MGYLSVHVIGVTFAGRVECNNPYMKSSRTLFLIMAVALLPGGLLLLLPFVAKPIGSAFARLPLFRVRSDQGEKI